MLSSRNKISRQRSGFAVCLAVCLLTGCYGALTVIGIMLFATFGALVAALLRVIKSQASVGHPTPARIPEQVRKYPVIREALWRLDGTVSHVGVVRCVGRTRDQYLVFAVDDQGEVHDVGSTTAESVASAMASRIVAWQGAALLANDDVPALPGS